MWQRGQEAWVVGPREARADPRAPSRAGSKSSPARAMRRVARAKPARPAAGGFSAQARSKVPGPPEARRAGGRAGFRGVCWSPLFGMPSCSGRRTREPGKPMGGGCVLRATQRGISINWSGPWAPAGHATWLCSGRHALIEHLLRARPAPAWGAGCQAHSVLSWSQPVGLRVHRRLPGPSKVGIVGYWLHEH